MAFLTSKLSHFAVHHIHKPGPAASDVLGQSIAGLIGRLQEHDVKAVLYAEHIPLLQRQFIAAA